MSIVRALGWDDGYEQRFLAVNPLGDEVNLYQTQSDPLSDGIVKVHTHTGIDHIQALAYLRREVGWTGVGTLDGTVHLFDISGGGRSSVRLRLRQSRPCNAMSFNDGTLVAASFDKSRQDSLLQVWDTARAGDGARPQHAFLANEATVLAAFDRGDALGMLLMAGGYKLLRAYDLRESAPAPIFQVATKCTLSLAFDHFQSHVFLSVGEDGLVALWDRRRLSVRGAEAPVLHFPKLVALRRGAPCLRHLSVRRGEFAAVFNGNLIRRWNTGCVPAEAHHSPPTFTAATVAAGLKQQAAEMYAMGEDLFFVALVLDCKTEWPRVTAFDYLLDATSPTLTTFVCLREKGLVFRMPVVESIEALDFNALNEFSIAGPEGTLTQFAEPAAKTAATEVASTVDDDDDDPNLKAEDEYVPLRRILDLGDVLANDICSRARDRAARGYGTDCDASARVAVATEPVGASLQLRNTWQWLLLAKRSLDKGTMVREDVDLGYVGVLAVWEGAGELAGQRRAAGAVPAGARDFSAPVSEEAFTAAVRAIVATKGDKCAGISVLSSSERKFHRKLCLIVSGWYLTEHELELKIDLLVQDGHVEKAAGWAVFHGDVPRAIDILAHAKNERLQVILTAVAGYLAYKDLSVNSPWNDQCRKLALELDHPYLRAIFAFIADNDWWDVLDEHALPLRERLGIAIRFLSDKDLHVYLRRVADTVVARGELEGLVLTGLTPRGIDLLQLYVDRTSDVQTAALIALYAVPRYFRDPRVDHWTDCYRQLLNLWGMFKARARFDVARTKLARTGNGAPALRPAPRQVYLQCTRCNKNMFSQSKAAKGRGSNVLKQLNRLNLRLSDKGVALCPHCGAPLPRCAICLLSLGTPVPGSLGAQDAATNFGNKFSFCLTCNHGYHAHHAEEWFSKHYVCPVPDCSCRCNSK